ncbi:hypothetical protein Tco_1278203 [Tanacetum coccineum]
MVVLHPNPEEIFDIIKVMMRIPQYFVVASLPPYHVDHPGDHQSYCTIRLSLGEDSDDGDCMPSYMCFIASPILIVFPLMFSEGRGVVARAGFGFVVQGGDGVRTSSLVDAKGDERFPIDESVVDGTSCRLSCAVALTSEHVTSISGSSRLRYQSRSLS